MSAPVEPAEEEFEIFNSDMNDGLDEDFISKINKVFPMPDLDKIQKQFGAIGNDIDHLESKIQDILTYQYNQYVEAFGKFMDSVRNKLREKIEEMEEREREYQKKNDIQVIKTERDFFRKEAVRLNSLCKDMSKRIEDMGFNMKLMNEELNTMTTKWKESENVNKQLLVELESNIQTMKDVEKENSELKDMQTKIINWNSNKNDYDSDSRQDMRQELDKMNSITDKMKGDLKKERQRHHKTLTELNKMILDKNKLESIFNDCVEEVRKDIFNRKLKETIDNNNCKKYMSQTSKDGLNIPYVSDIKYEKFLPNDKKKILEIFILKDDIIALIQELVFHKPKEEIENLQILQGISILNENRIAPVGIDPMNNTRNGPFNKTKFTFASSIGKRTHGSFNMKIKGFKPIN